MPFPAQLLALTVICAVPEYVLFQSTVPINPLPLIVPAPDGVIVQI